MHVSPFKKVNKTPTNSGTGFFYIVPGYKFTRDEAKKVHSMNFCVKDYTKWVWTKKSPQKPIDKKDISRPCPLGQPRSIKAPIYSIMTITFASTANLQIAQWRAKERASQKEQDEAWNILQRLKHKERYEDLRLKRCQDYA
ncbi:hypothetical protein AMATHDRAFT_11554 [Amanita thiersii Skay4041]|uniref:Uncharacterized protein n=1 Tax=Amanita thiersii Skay4041 TaxID=703135 RepID=A0A2A9N6D8_9AGAR|nr:hypothetical protein AMATHDRAFT_11554 [Amanita thiersii Skay4041]